MLGIGMFSSSWLWWFPFPRPHVHMMTCLLPARCHPKVSCLVGGLEASHSEKRLIRKLVRSTRMCAASVITARLPAICPPVWNTSPYHGSGRNFELTRSNFRPALLWIKGNIPFSVIMHTTQNSSKLVSFVPHSCSERYVLTERNKLNCFVRERKSPKHHKSCDTLVLWLCYYWTGLL